MLFYAVLGSFGSFGAGAGCFGGVFDVFRLFWGCFEQFSAVLTNFSILSFILSHAL